MQQDQHYRIKSDDGVEIVAHVYGSGPPLVLVHGALDDGELDWNGMVPLLRDRFTCYVMCRRGRKPSGNSSNLALDRQVQDVTTLVESIGEPVGVVGLLGGGMFTLGAAASAINIAAVAAYEPIVLEVMTDEDRSQFEAVIAQMGEAVAQGREGDAAQVFLEYVSNDAEQMALSDSDAQDLAARNLPVDLEEFQQITVSTGPTPTAPSSLAGISVPVLLLHGSQTAQQWFTDSITHVADHVSDARVCELEGAGHLGPIVEPQRVANEMVPFFESVMHRN